MITAITKQTRATVQFMVFLFIHACLLNSDGMWPETNVVQLSKMPKSFFFLLTKYHQII